MANYVFVDDSNIWIEGMRVSAIKKKLARDIQDASEREVLDQGWRLDFGMLLKLVTGYNKANIGYAVLYGSTPPDTDTIWKQAEDGGFKVVTHRRQFGREKKIDTGITTEMVAAPMNFQLQAGRDTLILVSGDKDLVPPVEQVRTWGFDVTVAYWNHAAAELKAAATKFIPLDKELHRLTVDPRHRR